MESLKESALPELYESYEAIAPAKYAGKLVDKVVGSQEYIRLLLF